MPSLPATVGAAAPWMRRLAPPLGLAAAAVIVFHGALAQFFSQDDFVGLARARDLMPRLAQPWRYLTQQGLWDVLRPLGTDGALLYHLVSLAAHAGAALLLRALLARRVGAPGAWLGALFFAVHPALYAALYWISALADVIALLGALAVLRLVAAGGARRWLAVPLFALALLAKESVILLPLALAVPGFGLRPAAGAAAPGRVPPGLLAALATVAAAYLAYFFAFAYGSFLHVTGAAATAPEAARLPYAIGWGRHVAENALTYLGWTANFLVPTVRGFSDIVDPHVAPWGVGLALAWAAGACLRPLRERGWLQGGLLFAVFVLPVLPLRNHTYHYYLYAPLAGAALCVAAAADWALARRGARRPRSRSAARGNPSGAAWAVALALGALLTVNAALLVRKIERFPFFHPELRADPIVDRARIARRVRDGLAAASLPPGVRLLFWSPSAVERSRAEAAARGQPPPADTYWERNVRAALYDGLALRVLLPEVAGVRFVRERVAAGAGDRFVLYQPDGSLVIMSPAAVDSLLGLAPE